MNQTPKISMIAAVASNRAIGKDNKLLWHLPEDLKRFKDITRGHAIIMGSKTFESLGRPLPHRANIVIAKDLDYKAEGCTVAHSLDEAIEEAKKAEIASTLSPASEAALSALKGERNKEKPLEVFIIGGGSIYAQFLPRADKLYITRVEKDFDADTFFPAYEDQFKKIVFQQPGEHDGLKYMFLELER